MQQWSVGEKKRGREGRDRDDDITTIEKNNKVYMFVYGLDEKDKPYVERKGYPEFYHNDVL